MLFSCGISMYVSAVTVNKLLTYCAHMSTLVVSTFSDFRELSFGLWLFLGNGSPVLAALT